MCMRFAMCTRLCVSPWATLGVETLKEKAGKKTMTDSSTFIMFYVSAIHLQTDRERRYKG